MLKIIGGGGIRNSNSYFLIYKGLHIPSEINNEPSKFLSQVSLSKDVFRVPCKTTLQDPKDYSLLWMYLMSFQTLTLVIFFTLWPEHLAWHLSVCSKNEIISFRFENCCPLLDIPDDIGKVLWFRYNIWMFLWYLYQKSSCLTNRNHE